MSRVDFHDPATIAFLADALQAAGVDGIEIEQSGRSIRIVVDAKSSAKAPCIQTATSNETVIAPLAGIFTQRSTVLPLQDVIAGDVLGFVRVGHVLVPVRAAHIGRLKRCLVEDGSVVGFGDPLFDIENRS